ISQQSVGKKFETPAGGDPRVKLPNGPGGGVARVGKLRQSLLLLLFVHALERRCGHEQLSAYLEVLRQTCLLQLLWGDIQRNAANGAHIRGYIFADRSVASRDSQGKGSGLEPQGHRHTVELQLAN